MLNIQEYVDIKNYSSLKIGVQFRYFVIVDNKEDLSDVFVFAEKNMVPIFILGGGSNIVFSDGVINVLALKIEIKGFEIVEESDEYAKIKVGAGEIWDKIVEKTVAMNLSGLEALSLIPGTVGATPVQNVGAYGSEVKDTIVEVEVFDVKENVFKNIKNEECKFGYRDSIFKNEAKGKYIITAVTYKLLKIKDVLKSSALGYPGVMRYFENLDITNPTLKQIRDGIIDIRSEKLPNPSENPNVGSFFKNPIVENDIVKNILNEFPNAKFFSVDDKFTKIPAGWLIENAGLKGKSFGNVSVYDKNALVLVNNGNATKEDLINTKNEIIKIVFDKFGITLEQEPEVL